MSDSKNSKNTSLYHCHYTLLLLELLCFNCLVSSSPESPLDFACPVWAFSWLWSSCSKTFWPSFCYNLSILPVISIVPWHPHIPSVKLVCWWSSKLASKVIVLVLWLVEILVLQFGPITYSPQILVHICKI